jgi:hypothetical protein
MAMTLDERFAALGRRIAAARARLEERRHFENDEVGDILEGINHAVEGVDRDDERAAHARYDRIEAELAEAEARLAAPKP